MKHGFLFGREAVRRYKTELSMKCFRWLFIFVVFAFGSCVSLSFHSGGSSSWIREGEKTKGTVRILSVAAEKKGERGSLEKEIKDLLPLLFLEEGYCTVSSSVRSDYAAEVIVREREYPAGWQTWRSLSAEVRFWAGDAAGQENLPPVPLSAGRVLVQGKESLASSKTLGAMLGRAVKSAVRGLPPNSQTSAPGAGDKK